MSDKKVSVTVEIGGENKLSADVKNALADLKKVEQAVDSLAGRKVEIPIGTVGGAGGGAGGGGGGDIGPTSIPSAASASATAALVAATMPKLKAQAQTTGVADDLAIDLGREIAKPLEGLTAVVAKASGLSGPPLLGAISGVSLPDMKSYRKGGVVDPTSTIASDEEFGRSFDAAVDRMIASGVEAKATTTGLAYSVRPTDIMHDDADLEPYQEPTGYWGNVGAALKDGWGQVKEVMASDNDWLPGQSAVRDYFKNIVAVARSEWAELKLKWPHANWFTSGGKGGGGGPGGGPGGGGGGGSGGGSWEQFSGGIKEAVSGLKQFQMAALAVSVAASAAVASTAPATWATFTGSIQLLSGEFANMLIPAFLNVSYWLQRTAAWVKSWDESTKGTFSTVATWGGLLLLGGAALSKVGALIYPVVTGVALLATGLAKASAAAIAFAVANPWVLGIVAATAAVGVLTNGFGLLGDSISRAGQNATEARERIARLSQGGAPTRPDYETIPLALRAQLERARPEQRQAILNARLQSLREEQEEIMRNRPSALQVELEQLLARADATGQVRHADGRIQATDAAIRQVMQRYGITNSEISRRMTEIGGVPVGPPVNGQLHIPIQQLTGSGRNNSLSSLVGNNRYTGSVAESRVVQGVLAHGIPGLFDGMTTARSPLQSRTFQSGDAFYADLLQNILGKDDTQRELMRQQMDNDQRMFEMLAGRFDAMGRAIVAAVNGVANPAP